MVKKKKKKKNYVLAEPEISLRRWAHMLLKVIEEQGRNTGFPAPLYWQLKAHHS